MNFIEIGSVADGYLSVRLRAAIEMYFEVKPKDGKFQQTIESILRVIPHIIKLDGDMMEAFDNAGRTSTNRFDIELVKKFAETFEFRKVDCALPGFDKLQQ
jgi:hypothetical protein